MIDRFGGTGTLSLLVSAGLPNGADTLEGQIERIGRFDESSGEIVPLAGLALPAGSTVCVSGWSADLHAKGAAAGVCIRAGAVVVDAHYGEPRDDVGVVFGGAAFVRTGFHGYVTLDPALRGELEVSAIAVSADARSASVLPGGTTFSVLTGWPSICFAAPRRSGSASVRVDGWQQGSSAEICGDEALLAPRGALIRLRGWVRDATADAPASGVFAVVDDHAIVRGNVWQPRPDVVTVMHRDDLLATGFTLRIDTDALAPGRHTVRIGIVTSDGEAYDLDERQFGFAVVPDHR